MTPNRREFEKQCTFQKFCKSVLHNEACNAHEEIRRRRVREVTFSDLALYEERQLSRRRSRAVLSNGRKRNNPKTAT